MIFSKAVTEQEYHGNQNIYNNKRQPAKCIKPLHDSHGVSATKIPYQYPIDNTGKYFDSNNRNYIKQDK